MSKQRPISQILGSSGNSLNRLISNSKRINRWNRRVQTLLPVPINAHCQVGNFSDGCLALIVDSPIWATKIRLFIPNLLKTLRKEGAEEIEIKVKPQATTSYNRTARRSAFMSNETSNLLNQLAESANDRNLKQALRRLSRHNRDEKN